MTNYANGVSGMVDANMNTASTQLQALQTQEQLGIQSLSIANQNVALILKLFQYVRRFGRGPNDVARRPRLMLDYEFPARRLPAPGKPTPVGARGARTGSSTTDRLSAGPRGAIGVSRPRLSMPPFG